MKKQERIVELQSTVIQKVTQTDWFCMFCGTKGIWAEGVTGNHTGIYGCTHCHESYAMNNWVDPEKALDMYAVARLAKSL